MLTKFYSDYLKCSDCRIYVFLGVIIADVVAGLLWIFVVPMLNGLPDLIDTSTAIGRAIAHAAQLGIASMPLFIVISYAVINYSFFKAWFQTQSSSHAKNGEDHG